MRVMDFVFAMCLLLRYRFALQLLCFSNGVFFILIDCLNINIHLINTIKINCPYRSHWVYELIPAFR